MGAYGFYDKWFIARLGNSDWVKEGLKYVQNEREWKYAPFVNLKRLLVFKVTKYEDHYNKMMR
jgi:hypothetical protein